MAREFTVGQIAKRSGVAVSTLHFYEAKGLIRSNRTAGNQRRYQSDVLRRISIIKFAQELGISLAEIGETFERLPENRTPTRRDWQRISGHWGERLDRRIARLQKLRESLSYCIGCGCLSLARCRVHNPNDVLAERGPGPQKLLE